MGASFAGSNDVAKLSDVLAQTQLERGVELKKIGFGGGCHWCTEAVFDALNGVMAVEQGFVRSRPPNDTWSEAVVVHFDPMMISLGVLVAIHVETHSAFSNHSMRHKYRSAVYTVEKEQAAYARSALARITNDVGQAPVTKVLELVAFKPSDTRFHDYYATNPDRPFCKVYISPKLAHLRAAHGKRLKT
ncbi:MAG: peptide-methionine (S)-S-oxide reductase [Pseudomonadota bacterium]